MKSFANRLIEFRDGKLWSNPALAQFLSQKLGKKVSVRTVEMWIQGRRPHTLWRADIESILTREWVRKHRFDSKQNE